MEEEKNENANDRSSSGSALPRGSRPGRRRRAGRGLARPADRIAVVRESCPTFSWTAVSWALAYKVVVFEAAGEAVPYEDMAAAADPFSSRRSRDRHLSWTPSADERLQSSGAELRLVRRGDGQCRPGKLVGRPELLVFEDPVPEMKIGKTGHDDGAGDRNQGRHHGESPPGTNTELAEKPSFPISTCRAVPGARWKRRKERPTPFTDLYAGIAITTGLSKALFGRSAGFATTAGSGNTFVGYHGRTRQLHRTWQHLPRKFDRTLQHGLGQHLRRQLRRKRQHHRIQQHFYRDVCRNGNTTGVDNIFIGHWAGRENTSAYSSIFLGNEAGEANTTESTTHSWDIGPDAAT